MKRHLKRVWPTALGGAIGTTIGGNLLPRLLHPERYSDAPPLILHAAMVFIVCFAVILALGTLALWLTGADRKN